MEWSRVRGGGRTASGCSRSVGAFAVAAEGLLAD